MEKRLPLPVGTILQSRYRIVRQLGHGGFGAVYEAVDDQLNLAFALKETFYAADEELRRAFLREARILASLSHDAFPRVTHYFTENDGCFLVMELIKGDDLDKLLAARTAPFGEEQVLPWADQLLDALEDLHQSQIIHRDIKPSNLRLTAKGKLKLLDFGIAKGAVEEENAKFDTVGSLAAVTIQYAPLEQVLRASQQQQMMLSVISADKVMQILQRGTDASSDLYALGATLYHLLTKKLPADAPTRALSIWSGQNDPLLPVHLINPHVSPGVSAVLDKAMKIDRRERLSSAAEMRRLINEARGAAASAIPVTLYQGGHDAGPKPEQVTVPAIQAPRPTNKDVTAGSTWPVREEQETAVLPQNNAYRNVSKPPGGNWVKVVLPLVAVLFIFLALSAGALFYWFKPSGQISANSGPPVANSGQPDANIKVSPSTIDPTGWIVALAFSPDGKTIASGGFDGTVKIWDGSKGDLKNTLNVDSSAISAVAFSPDGKLLAGGGNDGRIYIWNGPFGLIQKTLSSPNLNVESLAFSPDGKTLASGHINAINLWNMPDGTLKQTLKENATNQVLAVAFSPDGKTLAGGTGEGNIELWDLSTNTIKNTLKGNGNWVSSVAFSPDGKLIASGSYDKTVRLWDAVTGEPRQKLVGHDNYVYAVAFSPNGKWIVSASKDKTIKLWDATNGALKKTLTGHSEAVRSVAFSPNSKMIASSSEDKTVRLWPVE